MGKTGNIISRINASVIWRNVILAVCAIIVFIALMMLLLNIFTRHNKYEQVPDLSGMDMQQAVRAARKGNLRLEINDSLYIPSYEGGIILDQIPKPGVDVKKGRRVFVTTSSHRQKMVRIPYVTGYSLRQAKNNLEVAGLEIDKIIFRDDLATYNVLEQRFGNRTITAEGSFEAEQGSGITLVVGLDAEAKRPVVPKLVGLKLRDAKSRLWEAGLNVGELVFDDDVTLAGRNDARVYSHSPEQGTTARHGAVVSLRLTANEEKTYLGIQASDRAARRIIEERRAAEQAAAEKETEGSDVVKPGL